MALSYKQRPFTGYVRIMSLFADATNDVAFKKIFLNHKDISLDFLNATLRLEGDRRIKDLEIVPQENLPLIAESKKSIVDFRCQNHRGFEYIVEVQNKLLNSYIKRVQYYVSHRYASQLVKGQNYMILKPVTLLSILTTSIFTEDLLKESYLTYHTIQEQETGKQYLEDLSFAFVELPKFTKTLEELITPEDYWIYVLKNSSLLREIPKEAPESVKEALHLLEQHTWSASEQEAYVKANMLILDEQDALSTAETRGKKIGLEEGKRQIALKMLQRGRPLEEIREDTGLSLEEIHTLKL